jgi:hypothetical protein
MQAEETRVAVSRLKVFKLFFKTVDTVLRQTFEYCSAKQSGSDINFAAVDVLGDAL